MTLSGGGGAISKLMKKAINLSQDGTSDAGHHAPTLKLQRRMLNIIRFLAYHGFLSPETKFCRNSHKYQYIYIIKFATHCEVPQSSVRSASRLTFLTFGLF